MTTAGSCRHFYYRCNETFCAVHTKTEMSVYPPPQYTTPIFNPSSYIGAGMTEFLPVRGGTITGSLNVLSKLNVGGDAIISGNMSAERLSAETNVLDSTVLSQGAYVAWNSNPVGGGSTDFINKSGLGLQRGFNFVTSNGSDTPISDGKQILASILPGGIRVGTGSNNHVPVTSSDNVKIFYGLVSSTASTGTTNFPGIFVNPPIVLTTVGDGGTGFILVVNTTTIRVWGFSWVKQFQQAGGTGPAIENFSWIAIGV